MRCPRCHSGRVIRGGKTASGKQRHRGHNPDGAHRFLLLDPAYKGRLPAVKQQVIDMSLNFGVAAIPARLALERGRWAEVAKLEQHPTVSEVDSSHGVHLSRVLERSTM